jgi:hypothetical protein
MRKMIGENEAKMFTVQTSFCLLTVLAPVLRLAFPVF